MDLRGRIDEIKKRMAEAAVRSRRQPQAVTLLAVTKTFPIETIRRAYETGLREFGENRIQEALPKIAELPTDIRWHLIGQLQTNKINKIIGKFKLVHSIDSMELAQAFSSRLGPASQEILLEVNTSGEESKAGCPPGAAVEIVERISRLAELKLRGLMTVGPLTDNIQKQRDAFKILKELFESIKSKGFAGPRFDVLSMGMSGDFEMAIEEGSTLVRIGSALFGSRQ